MEWAAAIVFWLEVYGIAGAVVAAAFLIVGLDRIDPSAAGAYAFRPLLVPGTILLWPLVVVRWIRLESNRKL